MVFLDLSKKKWVIRNLELNVIEDIPMKDLRWFKETSKEALRKQKEGDLTELEAMEKDEEWWIKICEIGLNTTKEILEDTGMTEREFRELMAEVYHFLVVCSSIEGAKQSPLYAVLTQKKELKDSKNIQKPSTSYQ